VEISCVFGTEPSGSIKLLGTIELASRVLLSPVELVNHKSWEVRNVTEGCYSNGVLLVMAT
jgi:hypothetical protein